MPDTVTVAMLTVLASGTPTPAGARWGSSFLVSLGEERLMFDCGPGSVACLNALDIPATTVNWLVFTHHHYDHDADYPSFALLRFDQSVGREMPLTVLGPPPTRALTDQLFGEGTGAFWPDIHARLNHPISLMAHHDRGGSLPRKSPAMHARDVGPGLVFSGATWELNAVRVDHVQPYLDSLAYRLDTEAGSIVFSGDTRPCSGLTQLARGADTLVMECIRLDADMKAPYLDAESGTRAAGVTAREAGVGQLVVTHQSPGLHRWDGRLAAIRELRREFSGPIIWADRMVTVALVRTAPP